MSVSQQCGTQEEKYVIRTKGEVLGDQVKKGPGIVFPPKISGSSDRSASLCHISLKRSSQRLAGDVWPGLTAGGAPARGQTTRPSSLLSQQSRPALPHISFAFSLGASQGAAGAWGFPTLKPPWEVGEVTLTGSNCQPASQRRGKRGDRGQEERGGTSEERRRMTRG